MIHSHLRTFFFFFNDTATTEIYTLSLQRRSSDLLVRSRGTPRRSLSRHASGGGRCAPDGQTKHGDRPPARTEAGERPWPRVAHGRAPTEGRACWSDILASHGGQPICGGRSEERRVGKECRSR